jgi:hypothetical protein
MKIQIRILAVVLAVLVTTQLSRGANIIWTNTAGGNWSNTNNWSPNQTPGSGDVAVITNDASYTVTLDARPTLGGLVLGTTGGTNTQTFQLNNQTLTLNGTALVSTNGLFNLNGGILIGSNAVFSGTLNCAGVTLSGTLTVASNSVLNLGALDVGFNSYQAGIGILTNYGTINWGAGNINCDNSPVIDNYGLLDAQANATLFGRQSSGHAVINNYGTFRKSAGTGNSTVDVNTIFTNTGTLDVQTGTFGLVGYDSLAGGTMNFGINNSNNFGSINVARVVTLGGSISANLNNSYAPRSNASFAVLNYYGRTGTFSNYNLPAGFVWTTNYGNSAFSLIVGSIVPAQLTGAVATQGGTNFTFSFGAVPGQIYQIQYTTNLAPRRS